MKVAILAGGRGSRLQEETTVRPKPMVEIGGRPIMWHIMRHYATHGFDEFVIALGYKGEFIKRWFSEYAQLTHDLRIDLSSGSITPHADGPALDVDWTIDLVDTGQETNTGGRIKRLESVIGRERFLLTWGDGVSDVDIADLVRFHEAHGKYVTVTAVRPPARFGALEMDGDRVDHFREKPQAGEGWINGAFFVCEPEVFDYISGDDIGFEHEPLETLAKEGQLMAYKHDGFWQCMDTIRDRIRLEELWESGNAPWKVWA